MGWKMMMGGFVEGALQFSGGIEIQGGCATQTTALRAEPNGELACLQAQWNNRTRRFSMQFPVDMKL